MSMERRKHLAMAQERIDIKAFLKSVIEQQKLRADKPCEISLFVLNAPLSMPIRHIFQMS